MPRRAVLFSPLLAALLLCSCSHTHLVNRWHEPDYAGPALVRILLVVVIQEDIHRRNFEDELARRLGAAGLEGVVSYDLLPVLPDPENRTAMQTAVERADVDAILTAQLKSVDKVETAVPARMEWAPVWKPVPPPMPGYYDRYGRYLPYRPYDYPRPPTYPRPYAPYTPYTPYPSYRPYDYSDYHGYYRHSYEAVYRPGYTVIDTVVRFESRLFTVLDDRLIWAGVTESVNAGSSHEAAMEVAGVIVRDMLAGILR